MSAGWPEAEREGAGAQDVARPISPPTRRELAAIADAPRENWVDHFAPEKLKPWLRLMRADRPIGVWLLLWPCWWSVALASRVLDLLPNPVLLLLFAIGAFAMRSAGCIYNDILDRDIDAKVARTQLRPLASGQISVKAALALTIGLCLVGLAVLLQFNLFAICLGFASVGLVLIYPLMKRVTYWPQVFLGLAFSWGALMGWAVYFGSLALAPVLLYAAAVCWTIAYDTIYAHQDKEDDEIIGLRSTALRFGAHTKRWLTLFYGLTWIGITGSGWLIGAGVWFYLGMGLAASHLIWQIVTLDIDDNQNCLDRFRSNRGFGAIVFFALVIDTIPGLLSSSG